MGLTKINQLNALHEQKHQKIKETLCFITVERGGILIFDLQ